MKKHLAPSNITSPENGPSDGDDPEKFSFSGFGWRIGIGIVSEANRLGAENTAEVSEGGAMTACACCCGERTICREGGRPIGVGGMPVCADGSTEFQSHEAPRI